MPPRKRPTVTQRIADILDLPRDVIMDLPKLSVIGNNRLSMENHKGIIEYSNELVRINTTRGEIRITGHNLTLLTILRDEIAVDGHITGFEYVDWGLS